MRVCVPFDDCGVIHLELIELHNTPSTSSWRKTLPNTLTGSVRFVPSSHLVAFNECRILSIPISDGYAFPGFRLEFREHT